MQIKLESLRTADRQEITLIEINTTPTTIQKC